MNHYAQAFLVLLSTLPLGQGYNVPTHTMLRNLYGKSADSPTFGWNTLRDSLQFEGLAEGNWLRGPGFWVITEKGREYVSRLSDDDIRKAKAEMYLIGYYVPDLDYRPEFLPQMAVSRRVVEPNTPDALIRQEVAIDLMSEIVDRIDIPNFYGDSSHKLRAEIAAALMKSLLLPETPKQEKIEVHLSNEVIDNLSVAYHIGGCFEDRNLESVEAATGFYDWLATVAPGAFVLIDTGDTITPACGNGRGYHITEDHDCEFYDARYHYYIVPIDVWNAEKDAVLAADKAWRDDKAKCSLERAKPVTQE